MPLTDAQCRAAKLVGEAPQKELAAGEGLYLVVGRTSKSWVLRYKEKGKSRRAVLGAYRPHDLAHHLSLRDARVAMGVFKDALKKGVVNTPTTPSKLKAMTVSQAFGTYMRVKWGAGERDHPDKRQRARWAMFESTFEDRLGSKLLTDLTKAGVKALYREKHEAMKARGRTGRGIGNVQRSFGAFLNWCARNDDLTGLVANPAFGIPLLDEGGERDRWLDRPEVGLVLRAIRNVGGEFAAPLELLVRAGCRKSDIFDLTPSMVLSDIDDLGPHLLVPDTKNGQDLVVPLVPAMKRLMPDLIGKEPDECIWSCSGESTTRVKKRVDAEVERLARKAIPEWRLHDLRTTIGSHLDTFGADDRVVEKILGHKEPNKAKRTYRRYGFYEEKKAILQRWNDLCDMLVAKVVEPEARAA